MIDRLLVYESGSFDPYLNLAAEQHLLETVEDGCCLFYLWQNENTVVIGRNQNPWAECRTALLEAEGVHLARRLSGGGAVFHDLGNLNFTFLVSQTDYDLERQQQVLLTACRRLGIPAERSGRNDLLANGRKFSGNAFYKNGKTAYHHGTLLVNADPEKISRYLSPGAAKLESKGVSSVRSRIGNLVDLCPGLTVSILKENLKAAFEEVYQCKSIPLELSSSDRRRILSLRDKYADWDWNYGKKLSFSICCEDRFPWGNLELQMTVNEGRVSDAAVYSDDMDFSFPPALALALKNCRFRSEDLIKAVQSAGLPHAEDICTLLLQQEI